MENNLAIKIESTLPTITTNFEEIKSQLEKKLSVYDFLVQEDDVKKAKENATEINALKNELETMRKAKVNELSAPINDFNLKVKELVTICDNSRAKLLAQVKKFDDEKKAEILNRLKAELDALYNKFGLADEFKTIKVDDLAILSNATKDGITKKAYEEIESRVLKALEFQRVVEKRWLELDAYCYERGLEKPLTIANINHFLYEPDDVYYNKLNSLIDSEKIRLAEYRAKIIKETEITTPSPVKENQTQIQTSQITSQPKINKTVTADGKVKFTVTATFEIECDEKFEPLLADNLKSRFEKAIDKNGKKLFSTVPNIMIEKHISDGLKQGSLF